MYFSSYLVSLSFSLLKAHEAGPFLSQDGESERVWVQRSGVQLLWQEVSLCSTPQQLVNYCRTR